MNHNLSSSRGRKQGATKGDQTFLGQDFGPRGGKLSVQVELIRKKNAGQRFGISRFFSFFCVRSAAPVANGPKSNPIKCSPEEEWPFPGDTAQWPILRLPGMAISTRREAGPLMKPTFGRCGLDSVGEKERKNEWFVNFNVWASLA